MGGDVLLRSFLKGVSVCHSDERILLRVDAKKPALCETIPGVNFICS